MKSLPQNRSSFFLTHTYVTVWVCEICPVNKPCLNLSYCYVLKSIILGTCMQLLYAVLTLSLQLKTVSSSLVADAVWTAKMLTEIKSDCLRVWFGLPRVGVTQQAWVSRESWWELYLHLPLLRWYMWRLGQREKLAWTLACEVSPHVRRIPRAFYFHDIPYKTACSIWMLKNPK